MCVLVLEVAGELICWRWLSVVFINLISWRFVFARIPIYPGLAVSFARLTLDIYSLNS